MCTGKISKRKEQKRMHQTSRQLYLKKRMREKEELSFCCCRRMSTVSDRKAEAAYVFIISLRKKKHGPLLPQVLNRSMMLFFSSSLHIISWRERTDELLESEREGSRQGGRSSNWGNYNLWQYLLTAGGCPLLCVHIRLILTSVAILDVSPSPDVVRLSSTQQLLQQRCL